MPALAKATALLAQNRYADAAEVCQPLLKRSATARQARGVLARCYYGMGLSQELYGGLIEAAETNYRLSIKHDPSFGDAFNNLSRLLAQSKRPSEAHEIMRQGLENNPRDLLLLESFARVSQSIGKLDDAANALRKLATLCPERAALCQLREAFLMEKITPHAEYPEQIRKEITRRLEEIPATVPPVLDPHNFPAAYMWLSYHGLCNKDIVAKLAENYLKLSPELAWVAPHTLHAKNGAGKIKIGFASLFFYEHSIGNTSRGLIEKIDRDRFEVHVIRLGGAPNDDIARAIDNSADHVTVIPDGELQSAREKIATLELDILFYQDIGMEPISYFLAFARLARVQMTSFGHPETTGIPNLDYFLSCSNYEMENAQEHYTEKLLLIPQVGTLAYYHPPPKPNAVSKEEFGLQASQKFYFCPQTLFKIQPAMDEIFHSILEKDAEAVIVLIDIVGEPHLRQKLETRFAKRSDTLRERVQFVPTQSYHRFLGMVSIADVILDTVHFNGQNTSLEAFAFDVPVITLAGTLQRARHTSGMYAAMGLSDLVPKSVGEYVDMAVRVANDCDYRGQLSEKIHAAKHVLFCNENFVAFCEDAFLSLVNEGGGARCDA